LPPGPSGSVVDGNPVGRVTEVTVVVGSGPLEFGATTVVDVTLDGANPPPCPALAVSVVAVWLRRGPASVDVVDGPGTDQGTVVQDGMAYWRKTGLGGHRIAVFAEVAVDDLDEVKTTTHLFGSVGVGFAFPPPRWASSTVASRGTWSPTMAASTAATTSTWPGTTRATCTWSRGPAPADDLGVLAPLRRGGVGRDPPRGVDQRLQRADPLGVDLGGLGEAGALLLALWVRSGTTC